MTDVELFAVVRQGQRYLAAARQDVDPVIRHLHLNYAFTHFELAHHGATRERTRAVTGVDVDRELETTQQAQDRVQQDLLRRGGGLVTAPDMTGYGMTNEEWEKMGAAWAPYVTVGVVVGGTAFVLAMQERERRRREREHRRRRAAALAAGLPPPPPLPPFVPTGEPMQAAALDAGQPTPWIAGPMQTALISGGTLAAIWGLARQRWGLAAAGVAAAIFGKGIGA